MSELLKTLGEVTESAFEEAGFDASLGRITVSNRPDLCEFQCNGAMAGAKKYHVAPIEIANKVADVLQKSDKFSSVEAVMPGFINLKLSSEFLGQYVKELSEDENLGCDRSEKEGTIIIDYGGANVAKPLHIGHLRSAIIGESIKHILNYNGYKTIGDVHLGDWGLQMGLIIMELKSRQPDLPYFDDTFTGEYPKEAPFTISELEEIYPKASAKSKEDEEFKKSAQLATVELQNGHRGYTAIWKHIIDVSVTDLKKNYGNLAVEFDLWKGESDAQPYIPDMVQAMIDSGIAYESDGAIVVDIAEETDSKEFPPCIIRKSDGGANYETSDLATLVEREKLYSPSGYVYLADKRQELHYTQFFRVARKAGIVPTADLKFIGFGTMNGKDGKPFKTRSGGVMRLEYLLDETKQTMLEKIKANGTMDENEADKTAGIVALSALKYGDLSNQASKDYVFDIERFTSSEGNTGPYLLYTIVRIKSILRKYEETFGKTDCEIMAPSSDGQRALMLSLCAWPETARVAAEDLAPHKICSYLYDVANSFNRFYHDTNIMKEEDAKKQQSYIGLLKLARRIMEDGISLLGFEAPERM
ncbi:MAG: arginine--tRNA ligase [Lachnospiraceae bacterium]|nr:arginine--tRNA ligase [Lachnospiraceae bacterium]